MSTANSADATRGANTTTARFGANLALACRVSKLTWTTRGRSGDGEAESDGLSEELILIETEADEEVDGDREGDSDALGEMDSEVDEEGEGDSDSLPEGL